MDTISVNGKEFYLEKLLGKGKGGYSYLASPKQESGSAQFVVKQIHHEPCSYYQFGDKMASELNDYAKLASLGLPLPKLIEADITNERILKEYIPGPTIFECVQQDKMDDDYLRQVRDMCALLYPRGINIDYFPTNFVVYRRKLFYIDYECNNYMEEWNFENWGIKYWSKTKEFQEYLAQHH
ncbi:MAG: hypothetical protein ACI376_09165 [Candidatus Bruticola sp.]